MDRQRQPHERGLAQRQKHEARGAHPEQHPDEGVVHAQLCQRAHGRLHPPLLAPQPGRADTKHDSADGAKHHRQFQIAIGRFAAEKVVVDRAGAGRCEAQHETIEGRVMVMPPGEAVPVVGSGAPGTVA